MRDGQGRPVHLLVPAPVDRHVSEVFAATAGSAVDVLAATSGWGTVALARMTQRSWTAVAADAGSRVALLDRPVPVATSNCHHLLTGDRPVAVPDLHRHPSPALRALSRRFGVRRYVGAPLRRPDGGELLGSLCAWAPDPWAGEDLEPFAARFGAAAALLSVQLAAALDARGPDRLADRDGALRSADPVTGLPDRRGWGLLLRREEDRARRLAGAVSLVLVDTGLLRTARGVRRFADVLRAAAGDLPVARVSGRLLGVVAGDVEDPAPAAGVVRQALVAAGFDPAVGWAARDPQEGIERTWWRAEQALRQVRAGQPG